MIASRNPVVLAVCIVGMASVGGAAALSIEEAVLSALDHAPLLRAQTADRNASASQRDEAGTAYLPRVSLIASYARIKEREPIEFGGGTFGDALSDSLSAGVEFRQPLFTGGRIRQSLVTADLALERSQDAVVATRRDLILETRSAYWDVVEATIRVEAIQERLTQVAAAVTDVRNRAEAGAATRSLVLEMEMIQAEAELQALRAENALVIASARLATLVGMEPSEEIAPTSPLPDESASSSLSLDDLVDLAMVNRVDLAALRRGTALAEAERRRSAARRYPEVYLTGAFTLASPAPDIFPAEASFGTTWNVGILGRYELGDQPAARHAERSAREAIAAGLARVESAREAIALEVRTRHAAWRTALEEIRVAQTIARRAAEHLSDTRARVASGTALRTEELDAEALLLESGLAVTSARVNERLTWERLRRSVGEDP